MKFTTIFFAALIVATLSTSALADTSSSGATTNDQTNTSGSNTTISGGYSAESTTTYSSGSTNDTTSTTNNDTTNTTNNNSKMPVPSANSPSMSAYSQDICAVGKSGGLQLPGVGISGGSTSRDMNCERMKLSKLLNDYGMKVAAVAILCQDERVFEAMEQAGTPCPFEGRIGAAAMVQWKKYDIERPDYDKYVEKMDTRLEVDERIMKEEGTLEENETLKIDIKDISKENNQLQKDIDKLKKKQAELIEAQKEELKRLTALIPVHVEEVVLVDGEIIDNDITTTPLNPAEVTIEELENGRTKIIISPGR